MKTLFLIVLVVLPIVFSQDEPVQNVPEDFVLESTVDTYPDDGIQEITELYTLKANEAPCELVDTGEPNDVHHLTPKDIQIVAAIGDSITAGLFAKVTNIGTILFAALNKHKYEYRGVSAFIGGDVDVGAVSTLPNILKLYNPNIIGYSVGTGMEGTENAANNLAVSGAVSNDLPAQATKLVEKLAQNTEWKLITIFIGGNDLCAACTDSLYTDSNYYDNLKQTIDILKSGLTHAFINLLQVPDIKKISDFTAGFCGLIHFVEQLTAICNCMSESVSTTIHASYVNKIYELQNYYYNELESEGRDDFVVVVQPFYENIDLPTNSVGYFSADCFHFSQLGHAMSALHLWNNMIEPVGEKTNIFSDNSVLNCPNQQIPYFYTQKTNVNNNFLFGTNNNNINNPSNEQLTNGVNNGQIAGAIIGGIILVAIFIFSVTVIITGSIYLYRKKPRYSEYVSMS